ncbi:MAG: hypothetical protein IJ153_06485 [Clostridia bacterium]|nr:hypothetical protein [Clostridia bacterium]
MRKTLSALLMLVVIIISASAQATDIEVIGPNVNFRDAPHGKVIMRLPGGEILSAVDEAWANDTLWYQVHSEKYGDGFISGEWARPVYNGITIYDQDHPDQLQYVTENAESFYLSLYRFLYENGYCYWDQAEDVCTFRVSNGKGDESIVQPMHKVDLVTMLLANGLLVDMQEAEVLLNEEASDEEKLAAADSVLLKHYGTVDMWKILIFGGVVDQAETHVPHGILENDDLWRLEAIRSQVDHEYMGAK